MTKVMPRKTTPPTTHPSGTRSIQGRSSRALGFTASPPRAGMGAAAESSTAKGDTADTGRAGARPGAILAAGESGLMGGWGDGVGP